VQLIDPYYPEADIIEKIMELMHPEYRQYTRGQHFPTLFALESYAKRVAYKPFIRTRHTSCHPQWKRAWKSHSATIPDQKRVLNLNQEIKKNHMLFL
jgi:hypothetical protein